MAASLFKLVGDIYVNNDEANKSIQKTDDKAQKLGSTLLSGVKTAAKWGAAIAGAATTAVAGLVKLASQTAKTADEIDKASKRMGVSTDSYQELKYAAEQCGVEMGTLEKAAKKLEGTDINFDEAIADIMSFGTEAERSQRAAELFGDNIAYTLSPILAESGESFSDLRQRAHDLGVVMSKENVEAGTKLSDTMSDVKKAFGGIATSLGTSLVPLVQKVADIILDNLPMIQALFDELAPFVTDFLETVFPILLDLVAAVLPPLMDLVKALLPIFTDLVKTILPPIADILSAVLPIIVQIVNTLLPPLLELLQPILDLLTPILDVVKVLLQPLLDLLNLVLTPVKLVLEPIKDILEGVKTVIEALLSPIKALGERMSSLCFPSITVPDWAAKLLGIEGEVETHPVGDRVNWNKLTDYTGTTTTSSTSGGGGGTNKQTNKRAFALKAGGGLVDTGEVFIARESGPELVGRFGNQTAVANNEQIIQGIASGVASALAPVEDILMQIYQNGLQIDGEKVSKVLAPSMNYQLGVLKG
jgi:hypothetical protein